MLEDFFDVPAAAQPLLPRRPVLSPGGHHSHPAAAARAGRGRPPPGQPLRRAAEPRSGPEGCGVQPGGPRLPSPLPLARERARAPQRRRACWSSARASWSS